MAWHPEGDQWMIISRGIFLGRKTYGKRAKFGETSKILWKKLLWPNYPTTKFQNNPLVSSIQHQPSPRWPCLPLQWFHVQYLRCPPRFVGYVSDEKTWSGCVWLEIARLLGHERTRLNKIWSNSESIKLCLQLMKTSYTWMHQLEVSIFPVNQPSPALIPASLPRKIGCSTLTSLGPVAAATVCPFHLVPTLGTWECWPRNPSRRAS